MTKKKFFAMEVEILAMEVERPDLEKNERERN